MKALVGAFNQEKALVGAFSLIVQPVVEPMDSFTALVVSVALRGEEREFWAGLGLGDSIENTEQETNEEQFHFITNTYIH